MASVQPTTKETLEYCTDMLKQLAAMYDGAGESGTATVLRGLCKVHTHRSETDGVECSRFVA
mgnify:CR=1 FL=1